jgi:hypothetical protein
MTSPADWRDIWLNEGFASFSEALWFEHLYGFDGYRDYMTNYQPVIDPSGPLYDPDYLFDENTVYNKGAWVVHMLRGVLGDGLFYAALGEYRNRTLYRSTTTAEFQSIVEEVAEQDLDWFFEPWVYGVNRPEYVVSFFNFAEDGERGVAIHIDQAQVGRTGYYFPMPIDLEIEMEGGGIVTDRIWNDQEHEDFEIALPRSVTFIRLDPDSWILKEVNADLYTMHITTTDLIPGVQDSPYKATLKGRGGDPPYVWATEQGLPEGMVLDPETGVLEGTAPEEGTYDFTVRLTDSSQRIDTQRFHWTVAEGNGSPELTTMKVGPIPAHESAKFEIENPLGESITLTIYDLQGRRIRTLLTGSSKTGQIAWNGYDEAGERVASGVYLARLESPSRTETRRVVWLWKR